MKRTLFIILLLTCLSFASLIGEYSADERIIGKPVLFKGTIVFASADGNIYALNPALTTLAWKKAVGGTPNEIFVFDNGIIASISSGKLIKIDDKGAIKWTLDLTTYNATHVYGATANSNDLFVTADSGVYQVGKDGTVKSTLITFTKGSILTAPSAGSDYVVFGRENELYKVSDKGSVKWKKQLDSGSFWLSRPVVDQNMIYIGALDNKMHAYALSSGAEAWDTETKGWILSTALVDNGIAYFGSNDGAVYAVSTGSGYLEWKAQTQLAIQTQPESGTMGGIEVIFVGGSDRSIYAMSKQTGEIVWKGPSDGRVSSPLFYNPQSYVIFGSEDGTIKAYSTERACSITTPIDAAVLGKKEVKVTGKYVSENSAAKVMVNINNFGWEEAENDELGWVYYIDPSKKFAPGLNMISCMVRDSGGEENGPTYTSITINYDSTTGLSQLAVSVSPNVMEDTEFTVYVNDVDDGSPVERFTVLVNGREYTGDEEIGLTLNEPGSYQITVKKMGFIDKTITVNVNAKEVNPLYIAIGVLLIIIIIWQVWARFLKNKFVKK